MLVMIVSYSYDTTIVLIWDMVIVSIILLPRYDDHNVEVSFSIKILWAGGWLVWQVYDDHLVDERIMRYHDDTTMIAILVIILNNNSIPCYDDDCIVVQPSMIQSFYDDRITIIIVSYCYDYDSSCRILIILLYNRTTIWWSQSS